MRYNIFYRLRGPNIIGSSIFALTGWIISLRQNVQFDLPIAIFIILSMMFFNIYFWVSNDYYDAPYDSTDLKKGNRNVFCTNPNSVDYKIGWTLMWFSLIAGLIMGFLSGPIYFLITIAGMVLAYLYTNPIFRAKSRLGFDWMFHSIWFVITFLPLYIYIHGFDIIWGFEIKHVQFFAILICIALLSLLAQINHQIPDYFIDLETEQRTTVVVLGLETTKQIRYIIYFFIALSTLVICLINSAVIAIILIVIYSAYLIKNNPKKAQNVPITWVYIFLFDYLILSPLINFLFNLFIT